MNKLTPAEKAVIIDKGTERPFTGKYWDSFVPGVYYCRQCDAPLYVSDDKFKSGCGWPSFDEAVPGMVKEQPDKDGVRTEITCQRCGAHLGHVFKGEQMTSRNTRHCVNSISMIFIPDSSKDAGRAIFAGGCFWGVQYYLEKAPGVIKVIAGYTGGTKSNPTYEEVCSHKTKYAEAVEVFFDPKKTSFEMLGRLFFEIHDPTQVERQGPDIGNQYRSEIFYVNKDQKKIAEELIAELEEKGLKVSTKVGPATRFWPAEKYHQGWYKKKGGKPYCHVYIKRF
ncbi:MAG: bifunctional methionine sulfoxide reductase B/A protein [Lentisphaerae bacterium]|nr:bifunctional methionine sulfoxide reductase B/A protein [Lentisphaerota bacterium]MCP4100935.1 bifunctional methionine sulfoxide reductase B/A protein [Lentisphaerota bacterium]